jgi:arabinofuranan 3-O-arabinosyltransferase
VTDHVGPGPSPGPYRRTEPLRRVAYGVAITAACFTQASGLVVADTKFDLVASPLRFLRGALHMWDPDQAFGQLQNQAYGYLWPMGPFFLLGDLAQVPDWVIQRLWWALLLNVAFFGMLRLTRDLGVGRPWTQVLAAFAYILAPRMTALLGATSVELWPTALAPWVLVPLVRASRTGSPRRAAALSALVVATCGGVNATAVSAVLPLGLLWILSRSPGPRRRLLLGWWLGLTTLATLWWMIPLVQLGRYSPPFLDYIENAVLTSAPTGLLNSLLGTSDWVAYAAPASYPAGALLASTPFLLIDAAAVAGLGLAGLAMRDHPERRFVVWGLLAGLLLVGFGYAGPVDGWWGGPRQSWLDEVLAPLRNTHKYDLILRIVLSLGMAHVLTRLPVVDVGRFRPAAMLRAVAVVVVVGLASPWLQNMVAPPGAFDEAPNYWRQAAGYLAEETRGTAVVVPAAAFGDYAWGSTHDDVLQGYATSPWAARNVIPLAEPGNVVWLDTLTEAVERGLPSAELAVQLRSAGVDLLVVRNDLDRLTTGAPDPAQVYSTLVASAGLVQVAEFGPTVGRDQGGAADSTRYVNNGGASLALPSIVVFAVEPHASGATLVPENPSLMGGPGTVVGDQGPMVLTADLPPDRVRRVVLTDGLRRRAVAFQAVRFNQSATEPSGSLTRRRAPEQFHRLLPGQERWQTTEEWTGLLRVHASSSQAWVDAPPPLARGTHPGAALDGDIRTSWRTARNTLPDGQWWEVDLERPIAPGAVRITLDGSSSPVPRLRIVTDQQTRTVKAPPPGRSRSYLLDRSVTSSLRVVAVAPQAPLGSWGLAELSLGDVAPTRWLALPEPPASAIVERVELRRDPDRFGCPRIAGTTVCQPILSLRGEDGDQLARRFTLTAGGRYSIEASASLRRLGGRLARALDDDRGLRVRASTRGRIDAANRPPAMTDGDLGTTWVSSRGLTATIRLRWAQPVRLRSLDFLLGQHAPASAPDRISVLAGERQAVRTAGMDGHVRLPGWRVRDLRIEVDSINPTVDQTGAGIAVLPVGVSELRVNGEGIDDPSTPQSFPCGMGPDVSIGQTVFATRIEAPLSGLLQGDSVPLRLCGSADDVVLPAGRSEVVAKPSQLFRVDSVSLRLAGAEGGVRESSNPTAAASGDNPALSLARDDRGAPLSVALPARTDATVLVLGQNFNAGWVATLDGVVLEPQRVDGWQQGWRLPPGAAATVGFRFVPERGYAAGLALGAAAIGIVVLVLLLPARRRWSAPALEPAPQGWLDVALAVLAAGFLTGWAGAGATLVVLLLVPRIGRLDPDLTALAPGALVLLAATVRIVAAETDLVGAHAAASTTQALSGLALALVLVVRGLKGPRSFHPRIGRSKP